MKALLIHPEFPDTYWSFRHALPFEGKRAAFPPLGLLTVSSLLPRTWERRLVDLNVQPLKAADLDWADVVMTSAMLVQKDSVRRVVDRCKANGKRVVVGGPYVTTGAENLPQADHLVLGEAETVMAELARDLEQGTAKPSYKAAERPPLSASPVPDFRLADLKCYSAMSVQYSRGCPFQCEFCDIIEIYGRVPRTKSNEQILAEFDALEDAGWRGTVFVVDDNFIGNKPNVKQLMPELAKWQARRGFPFELITEASVNLAEDDDLLDGMRRAGFRRVFLGIETPVEESLRETKKSQNLRRSLLDSVNKIQGYGMEVMAGFIVGFDTDPEDIFERQIRFIRESAIPLAMVGLLNALPDTQLWRRLKREGRLLSESSGDNTGYSLNFVPRMNPEQLIEGYKSIVNTIYQPGEYYRRALDCLSRVPRNTPRIQTDFLKDLAAFSRVVFKLGFRESERRAFWHYLYRVFSDHREKLPQAMRLAAMGHHFRKLVEVSARETLNVSST